MAKKHGIEYILFYGSLLGALRTGDVIPYDSDIDLLMDVKYFPKMKEISDSRGFDIGDGKIRLVVQPEFDHNVSSNARKRYTCQGKVSMQGKEDLCCKAIVVIANIAYSSGAWRGGWGGEGD
jgi:hypothetical protein